MIHENKRFYNETFMYKFHADNKLHFKGCILNGCMFDNRLLLTFEDCTVEKCSIVPETQLRFDRPAARSAFVEKMERIEVAGVCGLTSTTAIS